MGIPQLGKVEIDVTADPDGNGGVTWSQTVKTVGHGNGNKIEMPKGSGSRIHFDLHDHTGMGIRFDASGPFFVSQGSSGACPTSLDCPQCMVDSCDADNLVVIDWNYGAGCDLHYQLNFVTNANCEVAPFDPIILNGGGGLPPTSVA